MQQRTNDISGCCFPTENPSSGTYGKTMQNADAFSRHMAADQLYVSAVRPLRIFLH